MKKTKRSPAQIAATKRMLAGLAASKAKSTKRNPVTKTKRAPKASPIAARVAKRKPKRKSNPVAAPKPAAVKSNPTTENPVKANRKKGRKHRQSKKQRAASLRNLKKARRARSKNPVKGNPVKANRKKSRKGRKSNPVKSNFKGRGERRQIAHKRNLHMGSVKGYHRKSYVSGHKRRTNPVGGLFRNEGPYTSRKLMNYGAAAVGLGLGLFATKTIDRLIATRTPEGGKHPWMGAAAVAAQLRRPDAMRLGAQAATGLGALGLAYLTRRVSFLPWFFTGVAFAAGATLVDMGIQWWLAPMIFRIKPEESNKPSLAQRLFVAEQKEVQDAVAGAFKKENWAPGGLLQAQADTPTIRPVLASQPGAANPAIFALGGLDPRDIIEIVRGAPGGQLSGPSFVADGTVGTCRKCGASGGHLKSCEDYCSNCSGVFDYEVDSHDNLLELSNLAGVDPNYVAGLNGNRSVTLVKPGEVIKVPFRFGQYMQETYGPNLEKHPGNQNAPVPEPMRRAAGQDFERAINSSSIDPAE